MSPPFLSDIDFMITIFKHTMIINKIMAFFTLFTQIAFLTFASIFLHNTFPSTLIVKKNVNILEITFMF